jgi:hypothetical protein
MRGTLLVVVGKPVVAVVLLLAAVAAQTGARTRQHTHP